MIPVLWPGETITVVPHGIERIGPGDIVVLRTGNGLVAHRLRTIACCRHSADAWLVTRGDACDEDDAPVNASELVGKAVSVRRGGSELPLQRERSVLTRAMALLTARCDLVRRGAERWHEWNSGRHARQGGSLEAPTVMNEVRTLHDR